MIFKKFFGSFFKLLVDNVVRIIKEILDILSMFEVIIFFVVGGYVEFVLIKEILQIIFLEKKIVILIDFSFFVLKGVVIYGFELEIIVFRVCKYIYDIVK